ncbi:MAG: hypothetical protein IV086_11050 [Hyphomonadaceae bacterium]|nr:MAG: hypothetical protein FD160_1318 [Caulobacteraceae bacterium]MBT9446227.1 hypothetical protein [Hyphomonadaceae bacterium]TPW07188.1 MAG: hypothetical protein FD124_1333 [Alphaproteobacteria bacterium]
MLEALTRAATDSPLEFWSIIANALTAVLALAAILVSVWAFTRQIHSEHYGEIDKIYFDLLKEAVTHPIYGQGMRAVEGAFDPGYDAYAFMVVNFVETILDRCSGRKALEETWQPIIELEINKHLDWLSQPQNQLKFKKGFLAFLAAGAFRRFERSADLNARMREALAARL